MNDIQITMPGNLVANPELHTTRSGIKVANLRIAFTPRMHKNGEWVDAGDTVFINVVAWRTLAETVIKNLEMGDRVTVTGRLRQRNYETESGAKRSVLEIHATDITSRLGLVSDPKRRTPDEELSEAELAQLAA